MLVTGQKAYGFLSGGCIEDDVALHAREVIAGGAPRRLVYGRGSPFIDMRLPCGGRLEVLVERLASDDPVLAAILECASARRPAAYRSDGLNRSCTEIEPERLCINMPLKQYLPAQRLVVIGSDPFALAIAGLGATLGWDVLLVAPFGPDVPPPGPIRYSRSSVADALATVAPDPWTAIAVVTHDLDVDHRALVTALRSRAGYVGVLGARRRLPERLAQLRAEGFDEAEIARLRAPIGLAIGSVTAWEVAVSVVGEIVAERNSVGLRFLAPRWEQGHSIAVMEGQGLPAELARVGHRGIATR